MTRKKAKPATGAQKRARERNWNKGQILGMRTIARNIHKSKTTRLAERLMLSGIIYKLDKILQDWKKS